MNSELYLRSISKRWTKEANNEVEKLYVLSPYITKSADIVLSCLKRGAATVYTTFEAEHFIAGASSLSSLRKLLDDGHQLYALPKLHAKLFFIPQKFASIGSQNLTTGGIFNREASVVVSNSTMLRKISQKIRQWSLTRVEITMEMIDDMEKKIAPYKSKFKDLSKSAKEIDRIISEGQKNRESEIRSKLAKNQQATTIRERQLSRMHQTLARIPQSAEIIPGRIEKTGEWDHLRSLKTFSGFTFTRWIFDDEAVNLMPTYRYLCVVPRLGRIGWARVVKSRISYVSKEKATNIFLSGEIFHVVAVADWSNKPAFESNVNLKITRNSTQGSCEVHLWFDAAGFKIRHIAIPPGTNEEFQAGKDLVSLIKRDSNKFDKEIFRILVRPFVFTRNLNGAPADEFFWGEIHSEHKLHLVKIGDQPVLVAEAVV